MELLTRYSNYRHLVKPLVRVLEEINTAVTNCNESITTTQGKVARPDWRARSRLAAADITILITQYQAGATLRNLAEQYKISRSTLVRILEQHHVPLRPRGLTPEQVDEAERLYRQGWSLAMLEARLGTSAETIRQHLRKRGVQMRKTWER